jgi:phosphonate transport system substrate-binding protein
MLKRNYGLLPFKNYLVRYSGGHEISIRGIADKDYEAAAVASDVLDRDIGSVIKTDQFRTVYTSPDFYPKAGLGYVYNLKPDLAAKVRKALLEFPWKGTSVEKHFGPAGQTRFVPVNYKTDWQKVREIDDAVGHVEEIKDEPPHTTATTRATAPTTR